MELIIGGKGLSRAYIRRHALCRCSLHRKHDIRGARDAIAAGTLTLPVVLKALQDMTTTSVVEAGKGITSGIRRCYILCAIECHTVQIVNEDTLGIGQVHRTVPRRSP